MSCLVLYGPLWSSMGLQNASMQVCKYASWKSEFCKIEAKGILCSSVPPIRSKVFCVCLAPPLDPRYFVLVCSHPLDTRYFMFVCPHPLNPRYFVVVYCHTRVQLWNFSIAWNLAILQVGPRSGTIITGSPTHTATQLLVNQTWKFKLTVLASMQVCNH